MILFGECVFILIFNYIPEGLYMVIYSTWHKIQGQSSFVFCLIYMRLKESLLSLLVINK